MTGGGQAIEAFSLHLPIDRPPGTDPAAQTARWVSALTAAGYQVRTMYVSHLEAAELAALAAAFPGTDFRQRVGTRLWLGSRSALTATATVLQVFPVRRGERFGYRQHRSPRDGWLVIVAGGTAHGVGLQAPGGRRGLAPRARSVARSGLAAMNRVRSPFTWDGRRQWFAEPPHMLVSMLLLPGDTLPPSPRLELRAELRYITTRFDRVVLSEDRRPGRFGQGARGVRESGGAALGSLARPGAGTQLDRVITIPAATQPSSMTCHPAGQFAKIRYLDHPEAVTELLRPRV